MLTRRARRVQAKDEYKRAKETLYKAMEDFQRKKTLYYSHKYPLIDAMIMKANDQEHKQHLIVSKRLEEKLEVLEEFYFHTHQGQWMGIVEGDEDAPVFAKTKEELYEILEKREQCFIMQVGVLQVCRI